jgi:acetyl esterase/lipase
MKISILIFILLGLGRMAAAQTTHNLLDSNIIYIHDKPVSRQSQQIQRLFSFIGQKRRMEKTMRAKLLKKQPATAAKLPKSLRKKANITISEIDNHKIWTIRPKANLSKNKPSDKRILYIHGGAYVHNILKYHWQFLEDLLDKTGATLIIPDYPLAPKANYIGVYGLLSKLYAQLLAADISPQNIIFMGDSAGGGLALGFGQALKEENLPQPAEIVLLSPWLDISMDNAELNGIDKQDKMLSIVGLQLAGAAYAGDLPLKNSRLSPIYGDMSGLGKISIFTGSHDLLIVDARQLKAILLAKNISFNYFEYPKLFHAFMIFTKLAESKHVLAQISLIVE